MNFTIFGAAALAAALGLAEAAVPAPWSENDVGSVGLAGSAAESGGTWALYGSGADIWGTADGFHFVHQRLSGNVTVTARVMGVVNTHGWAKAGVMIREDLNAGSKHAFACLTPSNGVAFQNRTLTGGSSENANVAGLTSPYFVRLVRSGDVFTAFRSADGVAWIQVGAAKTIAMGAQVYVGLAATSHDNDRLGNAGVLDVQVQGQAASGILLVAGSTLLNAGDAAVKRRLEALGQTVTVKAASAAVSADANGKALVVISSSVASGDVNTKFRTAAVPVITWENAILDDMGMTGAVSGTDYGTTGATTALAIVPAACDRATMYTSAKGWGDGCHDLAAGLTGTFDVTRTSQPLSWGKPNANAIKIAQVPGNANQVTVFAYEKNTAMPGLTAPARRIALFPGDLSPSAWTGRGQALFDRAVYWALGMGHTLVKKVLVLNFDPVLEGQGGLRMSTWGRNRTGWWGGDPWPLVRDYLADLTEASGGYVRWRIARYGSIPDYIDRWGPITGPEQFDSPTFSEQEFIDAYNYALDTWDWGGAGQRMPNGGSYQFDYDRVLNEYGVDAKVNAGEVDEVIIPTHPYSGMWESAMAGNQPYWINGGAYFRPAAIKNYVVMNLSYERGLSEVLENYGHRIEWTLSKVFGNHGRTISYDRCFYPDWNRENEDPPPCGGSRQTPVLSNLWDRIGVVEGILPGQASVGAAHWAPNALLRDDEYVWHKDNQVWSTSDDWLFNYPALQGSSTRRLVNVYEWQPMAQDGDAGRGFKKWWYFHMPRVPGRYSSPGNPADDGRLNNWWEYMVNHNAHPESDN